MNDEERRLRELLNRVVVAARRGSPEYPDIRREAATRLRELSGCPGFVASIKRAVGRGKWRKIHAFGLLGACVDVPCVVDLLRTWIRDRNADTRSLLIQAARNARIVEVGQELHDIIELGGDAFCRDRAINAAGKMQSEECFPLLLRWADIVTDKHLSWRLAMALCDYGKEEGRTALTNWFRDDDSAHASRRTLAAGGLAKLGDAAAEAFLTQIVEAAEKDGCFPDQAFRAAQVLCQARGWPFVGSRAGVLETKRRLREERAGSNG